MVIVVINQLLSGYRDDIIQKKPASADAGFSNEWLPVVDTHRTIFSAPSPEVRAVYDAIREFGRTAG
jgi:hypothetical protein